MYKNLSPGALGIKCSWLESLDLAKEAGFGGADLNLGEAQKLTAEQGAEAVQALYTDRGLEMGGWGFPVNWRASESDFIESLGKLPAQAKLAAELGCFRTATWVLPFNDDLTRQQYFDRLVRRFRLSAEVLRDHGHRLGLEFIGPRTLRAGHKHGVAYTLDGMLNVCAAIGTGNVGLLFDVWHWYTSQGTLDDVRQLSSEDIVHVHLNDAPAGVDVQDQVDNRRCLPGETGVIPNGALLGVLHELGYDGPVTVEPFSQSLREIAERSGLEAARKTRESMDLVYAQAGL